MLQLNRISACFNQTDITASWHFRPLKTNFQYQYGMGVGSRFFLKKKQNKTKQNKTQIDPKNPLRTWVGERTNISDRTLHVKSKSKLVLLHGTYTDNTLSLLDWKGALKIGTWPCLAPQIHILKIDYWLNVISGCWGQQCEENDKSFDLRLLY